MNLIASLAARRQVLEKTLPRLGGELLQYFGDGSLSIFRSAVEGVTASIEIQRELQSPPKLPVRVGLHVGDIAYDEQGAYGDAVNIAARIEDLSIPGGILISGKIAEEIKNHPELTAVRLGSYELKNVPDAFDIYAILAEGIEVPRPTELTQHGTGPDTVREPALPRSLQAHLDRIRQQPVHRVREARVLPRPLPLTGRGGGMEVLRSLLDDVEAGRGGAVFISGDRGVGKSRLAEAVAEHARERGWLITLGRAYPAERAISFAPLSDAFLPILRGIDPSLRATLMGDASLLYSLLPTWDLAPRIPASGTQIRPNSRHDFLLASLPSFPASLSINLCLSSSRISSGRTRRRLSVFTFSRAKRPTLRSSSSVSTAIRSQSDTAPCERQSGLVPSRLHLWRRTAYRAGGAPNGPGQLHRRGARGAVGSGSEGARRRCLKPGVKDRKVS